MSVQVNDMPYISLFTTDIYTNNSASIYVQLTIALEI